MSRHPYTHAADFIRALGPVGPGGVVLSRSDASQIRQGIAKAIGMSDVELAEKLSLAHQVKVDYDPTPGPARDVGVNPIPGDIVHVSAKCRHVVTEVRDGVVHYTDYDEGTVLADYVPLEKWRKWHRKDPRPVTKAEELK